MAEPTTTTTRELEITLNMQNLDGSDDWKTKTLTLANPDTTAGGLSAIQDFCNFLLTSTTITGYPALAPSVFFQPTNAESGAQYSTKTTTANIVETTKTITPIA